METFILKNCHVRACLTHAGAWRIMMLAFYCVKFDKLKMFQNIFFWWKTFFWLYVWWLQYISMSAPPITSAPLATPLRKTNQLFQGCQILTLTKRTSKLVIKGLLGLWLRMRNFKKKWRNHRFKIKEIFNDPWPSTYVQDL